MGSEQNDHQPRSAEESAKVLESVTSAVATLTIQDVDTQIAAVESQLRRLRVIRSILVTSQNDAAAGQSRKTRVGKRPKSDGPLPNQSEFPFGANAGASPAANEPQPAPIPIRVK